MTATPRMCRSSASFLLVMAISCFFLAVHARPPLARPASHNNVTASCISKERDALLDFKHGLNDTENLLVSWQDGQDCCRWLGVTCNRRTGSVLRLDLSYTTLLDGSLEGQQISPSLLSLEHLEYLDLSAINPSVDSGPNSSSPEFLGSMKSLRHLDLSGGLLFYGSIPPQLSNLSKLEYLDLSGACFSGRVPPELSNLTNLRHLNLGDMQDLYSTDISWLSHLHLLEYLDLSYMNLSMSTDWPHVLNSIPSLKVLNLKDCNLPQANRTVLFTHLNLTHIVQLDLSSNYLGRPLSSFWFWNVTSLESLELSKTHLFGPFPSALGSLTSLQFLGFNDNGNGATMLVDLKDLSALQHLHLRGSLSGGNINDLIHRLPRGSTRDMQATNSSLFNLDLSSNHLTGTIPPSVPSIIPGLGILDLSVNNLTGAIPQAIRNCTGLDDLILRSNQLSGQIPILPRNISRLDLSMNHFSGPLPLQLGDLETLILSSNHITGQIPQSICESQYLTLLDLSDNYMDGTVPQCHKMPSMIFLLLNHNNFSGTLPSFLRSTILVYMDLSSNSFYGTLPVWIGEMVNLVFLRLGHNMFYGHIPLSITNLTSLRYLDLAGNNISGAIPGSLSKLIAMTEKHPKFLTDWFEFYSVPDTDGLHPFGGIFSVVMKGQERNYGDSVYEVVGIDFSLNYLTGGIPDDITSLNRLLTLNLSWNQLSGNIPENIGVIKSLESLDLSWNSLSGQIPPSLVDLTYLSNLDLSHNNLTGRIPQGRQLDTLYTENHSIYDGNNGLCGPPLQRNCSSSKLPENGNQKIDKKHSDVRFFYIGLGSGFMAGLWVVFCVVLFKRTWRIAYFHLFDSVCDEVYVFSILAWAKLARKATTDSD